MSTRSSTVCGRGEPTSDLIRSVAHIAQTLNVEKVLRAHGGAQWHPSTVRAVAWDVDVEILFAPELDPQTLGSLRSLERGLRRLYQENDGEDQNRSAYDDQPNPGRSNAEVSANADEE